MHHGTCHACFTVTPPPFSLPLLPSSCEHISRFLVFSDSSRECCRFFCSPRAHPSCCEHKWICSGSVDSCAAIRPSIHQALSNPLGPKFIRAGQCVHCAKWTGGLSVGSTPSTALGRVLQTFEVPTPYDRAIRWPIAEPPGNRHTSPVRGVSLPPSFKEKSRKNSSNNSRSSKFRMELVIEDENPEY